MKKDILLFSVLFIIFSSSLPLLAQKKISIGGGIGMSKLTGDLGENASFGLHYSTEANYHFTPHFAAGLAFGNYTLGYGEMGEFFGTTLYRAAALGLKAEYKILTTKVAPYLGFEINRVKLTTPEIEVSAGSEMETIASEQVINMGFSPRLGVMIGGLKIELAYQRAGNTPKSVHPQNTHNKAFNFFSFSMKYNFSLDFNKQDE